MKYFFRKCDQIRIIKINNKDTRRTPVNVSGET